MAKYFFSFIFIFQINLTAQQVSVKELDDKSLLVLVPDINPKYNDHISGSFSIRDYSEFTNPSLSASYKLPGIDLYLAIPSGSKIDVNEISFTSELLEKVIPELNPSISLEDSVIVFNKNDYSKRIQDNINHEPVELKGYFYYRDFYIAHLKINNYKFIQEKSSIEVLKNLKFKIKLLNTNQIKEYSPIKLNTDFDRLINSLISNSNMAEQFRNTAAYQLADTTGSWINYNSTYLKFGIAKDGIFRISKTLMDVSGVPVSLIDPKTIKIFESGKELRIIVKGEHDGSFDDGDYIEFWGHKNYPQKSYRQINKSNEEYNEYLNRYTDTTYYFLTWGDNFGLRADTLISNQTNVSDTLEYYSQLIHAETQSYFQFCDADEVANQTPNWLKNKSWYWNFLFTQLNYNINLTDVYPDKEANIYTKLVSFASNIINNSHQVKLYFNNIQVDSNSINRFEQVVLHGKVNSSGLINGTNQIRMQNLSNGSSPNSLILDWYEAEYPRYLNLISDSLYFKIADDVSSGVKLIKIGNATQNSYRIYKINPQLRVINNYSVNASNLYFVDSVSPGDKYYIISDVRSVSPKFYYVKNFLNLRTVNKQTDYISITHPKFLNSVQNYAQSISDLYNLSVSVYNVQDIFDEFSFGYPYPEAIRLFANVLFNNSQSPKPAYLTLIGDANYDYKYFLGTTGGKNFVPSYGNPVSDNWYAVWDPSSIPIPQLKVGRIPINEPSELDYYFSKIENNQIKPFDEWNKKYLFFSGGRSDVAGELEYLKSANDMIINNYVSPRPVSGEYTHFYKTRNPQTDFGPYTPEEINSAISAGGLFISYIGHSGTATWDNSINSTNQLLNTVNRNPLITDFGCSTNKYAEPNIICFGERFLISSTGQAIAYVGNSSLGFQSTAVTAPIYFYEGIFNDSLSEIGNASLYSKVKLFSQIGNTAVNRIYSLTNVILGDPAIRLKIPKLPNLKISNADVIVDNQMITEAIDSVYFKIIIRNLGLSTTGNVEIKLDQLVENELIRSEVRSITIPEKTDTIGVWLLTKNKPGNHSLNIQIDPNNLIEEIYKTDNSINFNFTVFSASLRDLLTSQEENSSIRQLKLLNPVNYNSDSLPIEIQLSQDPDFTNSTTITTIADTFLTKITLPQLANNARYYLRYKIDSPSAFYSGKRSFFNLTSFKYLITDSLSFNNLDKKGIGFKNDSLQILLDTTKISVLSAGYNAGATCVIAKDGVNLLSNTYFAGMGIVVFDNVTLDADTSAWFNLFNLPANVEALATLIDSIPYGKIVALGVADDAANNISIHLKNAIKSLGSSKIDSLQFRGSWALIGWKGAPTGSVLEGVKPASLPESVFLESSKIFLPDSGFFETPIIGKASTWRNVLINQFIPDNASTEYILLGIRDNGKIDSLKNLTLINGSADISDIDPKIYPSIKLKGKLIASTNKLSPKVNQIAVDFISLAELGTNYQAVHISEDTIMQGNTINLSFKIFNVGETNADSFHVITELIKSNNNVKLLADTLITNVDTSGYLAFNYNYVSNSYDGYGNMKFRIKIDPDNRVKEFYKDNNVFEKSFYVTPDTTPTSVTESSIKITFDGTEIIDGDYVSPKPEIFINLQYPVWFPVNDTSAIRFYLDGNEYFSSDIINSFDTVNRIASYKITPALNNGDHLLKITGRDRYGNPDQNASIERFFIVDNKLSIANVYNYPNPFSDETYFTFKLSQIPEELEIKIFTISGRLIKVIKRNSGELNYDFNKIIWNGRDEDGDIVASGVYLYKIILHKSGESINMTQKLAIVR